MELRNEFKFLGPNTTISFVERDEKGVVLRHRIGQLHKFSGKKWPHAAGAARHRLKWIHVEAGSVILDIQRLEPREISMHHRRPKTDCVKRFQRDIDSWHATVECA